MFTTLLELAGVALVAAFGWFLWPPLLLLVVGVAALAAAWALERADDDDVPA